MYTKFDFEKFERSRVVKNEHLNVVCKIEQFRYLSNINGLSLLDSTYLERLIVYFIKNKDLVCFEGVLLLEELLPIFIVTTNKGAKKILDRLVTLNVLLLCKKIGKYHENKYAISINLEYTKYFFKE